MKLGAVFPQGEIDPDPVQIRDFAQAVEGMGYDYLLLYELIIDTRSEQDPAAWQEPFTLMGYLAAVTESIELATAVVVLPSRATVLVAKQVAELDNLCGGRLRLGVSGGWNQAEYQAMGVPFRERGQRMDEQIQLLRRLWQEPFVSFQGQYHTLSEVGIYPRPSRPQIPIWIGGYVDAVLQRIARLGDGWLSYGLTPETAPPQLEKLRGYIDQAGRDPDEVGLQIVGVELDQPRDWEAWIREWQALGATHMDVVTREAGLRGLDQHLERLRRFIAEVGRSS